MSELKNLKFIREKGYWNVYYLGTKLSAFVTRGDTLENVFSYLSNNGKDNINYLKTLKICEAK